MPESRFNSIALVSILIGLLTFGGNFVSAYNAVTVKLGVLERDIQVLHDKLERLERYKYEKK